MGDTKYTTPGPPIDCSGTNFWNQSFQRNGGPFNLHYEHLWRKSSYDCVNNQTGLHFWNSDWDIRSNCAQADSDASCLTCHNVHGSPTGPMIRHGELISTNSNGVPGDGDLRPAFGFKWIKAGDGTATATFTPTLAGGTYDVYAWWVTNPNRATNAKFIVNHDGGQSEVIVNQEQNASQWNLLGQYAFSAGTGSVVLTSEGANEYIMADGVRWYRTDSGDEVIVDDADAGYQGAWTTGTGGYNDTQKWHYAPTETDSANESIGGRMGMNGGNPWQNYMCKLCHSADATWTRKPMSTEPTILQIKADPNKAPHNQNTTALFTVRVSDTDNTVTSVVIDLSSLGGSSGQAMYDDGTNGDFTASNGTYSYQYTVPSGLAAGSKSLPVTATDGESQTDQENGTFTVLQSSDSLIADNSDIVWQGDWTFGTTGDMHGEDICWSGAGDGSSNTSWAITVYYAGCYNVYAWWSQGNNRATNAPYTIHYEGGSETVRVSQEVNGGQWNLLGTYDFRAGVYSVVLSDDADELVYADAIKFEPCDGSPYPWPISDNRDAAYAGTWTYPGNPAPGDQYSSDFYYSVEGTGADIATWTLAVPTTGTYSVYGMWPDSTYYARNAPFTINHAGGPTTVRMSQEIKGGQRSWLGTYIFNAGNNSVALTDDADDTVIADAIKFVAGAHSPAASYPIVDNPDADYAGPWVYPDNPTPGDQYSTNFYYNVEGTGADTATWTIDVPTTGTYSVYTWWTDNATYYANDAPYTINHAGGADTVIKSQKLQGGQWNWLGTYTFNAGNNTVVLTDNASDTVIADAIKFVAGTHTAAPWPIADNPDADIFGAWYESTSASDKYGANACYSVKGTGADTATWTVDVPTTGT